MKLDNGIEPWLFLVEPFEGESLSHFLGRIRRLNYLSPTALGALAGIGGVIARWEKFYHNPFPSDKELSPLGEMIGLSIVELKLMLPSKNVPMKCDPIRLCGGCYGDLPYHRLEWQFQSVWKCSQHQLKLISKCPRCGAMFKIPALWDSGECERCGLSFAAMAEYQKPC